MALIELILGIINYNIILNITG